MTTEDRARAIDEELEAALEAVAEHQRVSARLARAREAEESAQAAAVQARQELVTEAADVRKLESYSPTRIWAALRGSRDADLDRERAEHRAAEYAVARTEAWLLTAAAESRQAAAVLAALGDAPGRRESALRAKEQWLTSSAHADGGGMLTDMVKYERMDEVQQLLHDADLALRTLAVELADVDIGMVVRELGIGDLAQAFDVFFDNVFSDWSVRQRIIEAQTATASAAGVVHGVRQRLAQEERTLAEREATLVADRERILTGQ